MRLRGTPGRPVQADRDRFGWSIGYRAFFLAKLRRMLLRVLELPADQRPFRLFTTSNDVISTHVRAGGAFEPEVLGMISAVAGKHALRNGVALDIGANLGNHAVWMSRHFRKVVAFEPNPIMALVLRANAALNACANLQVVQTALSDHVGSATLVSRRADHIGTLELDKVGSSAEGGLPATVVELRRGDDVLGELGLSEEPVAFIKLDIEGAEVAALRGLAGTLRRHHPVVCFEARNPREGEAVRQALRAVGYSHFFAVRASRIGPRQLFDWGTWRSRTKHYDLVPLEAFEDRHYAAVFAWTASIA